MASRSSHIPLSVREGGWRKRVAWRLKGWRELLALWLAPWLRLEPDPMPTKRALLVFWVVVICLLATLAVCGVIPLLNLGLIDGVVQ